MIEDKPIAVMADEVPVRSSGSNLPSVFHARLTTGRQKRQLGNVFGLTVFGVNLTRLAPGGISSMRHWHSKEDEFLYVLEGTPTLVTDRGEVELKPGMCAGFKGGESDAHHLVNRGTTDAVYLEVGDRSHDDAVTYADEDLLALPGPNGKRRFTRKDGTPY
jgi:uncharacterized cupin superfamily protein